MSRNVRDCQRQCDDPYFQHFTGEEFFQHEFPHERSDLSHWRKRLGNKLELLLAESLRVAHQSGALRTRDLKRVTVDTTVQPKAITFPTDAKLLHAAIKGLNRMANKHGVRLRQSYLRIAKRAAMMAGRYAHAKQFNRHRRELRMLRTRLGRIIRDIRRRIVGKAELEAVFAWPLLCASQIRSQNQRQRGWKLYSFHAPEVECIGKGKASAPYEFGVKASIVSTNARAPGGQFVLHAKALPGNPSDGHTLAAVIDGTEKLTGCEVERAYVDKGYRGHQTANPRRVFISGQKRGIFGAIKRELRRRSAIEAVIGHMKNDGHLGRCYLKGRDGETAAFQRPSWRLEIVQYSAHAIIQASDTNTQSLYAPRFQLIEMSFRKRPERRMPSTSVRAPQLRTPRALNRSRRSAKSRRRASAEPPAPFAVPAMPRQRGNSVRRARPAGLSCRIYKSPNPKAVRACCAGARADLRRPRPRG